MQSKERGNGQTTFAENVDSQCHDPHAVNVMSPHINRNPAYFHGDCAKGHRRLEESRIGLKRYHPKCRPFTTLRWKRENTGSRDALPASDSVTKHPGSSRDM